MEQEKIEQTLGVANKIAMSMLGVRYKWGGNTPAGGLDCSGFALIIAKSMGLVGWAADMTASGLKDELVDAGGALSKTPGWGKFIFYGLGRIVHVAWFINGWQVIGAQGGGSKVLSLLGANQANAFVKVLPWWYRHDVNCLVDVRGCLMKIHV